MDLNRIKLIFHTVKYLRFKQIAYRVLYSLGKKLVSKEYTADLKVSVEHIKWSNTIQKKTSYLGNSEFRFLNITQKFEKKIDWNYDEYGKLWTYNLNYFDFLNQSSINQSEALLLMEDYVSRADELKDGLEPYPISLRGINWVKYLSKENIQHYEINKSLYNQYLRLLDNLEYHILGNHLLENGLSLLFGAYYFKNDIFYSNAKKIIEEELEEQILLDGAHFELSPMYHQIILDRVLDCIFLLKNNVWKENIELLSLLKLKASEMTSWLSNVTFQNDTIPMVNDCAHGIAPNTSSLIKYAARLKILYHNLGLSDSGYRKFSGDSYELFADVGEVGPSYQPGHAHADTFSFILHFNKKEIIVDPGISTYNVGARRDLERSTTFHNTVSIINLNSSNVWHGFRVANRAKVKILEDSLNEVVAVHNGYKNINTIHKRRFSIKDFEIIIEDEINNNFQAQSYLHFHPNCKVEYNKITSQILINSSLTIKFTGSQKIKLADYEYSLGFNKLILAKKVIIDFKNNLTTKFYYR